MDQDHPARTKALGARELDVVLVHDLAGSGARQAGHQGHLEQGQIDGRQEQVAQPVEGQETDLNAQ